MAFKPVESTRTRRKAVKAPPIDPVRTGAHVEHGQPVRRGDQEHQAGQGGGESPGQEVKEERPEEGQEAGHRAAPRTDRSLNCCAERGPRLWSGADRSAGRLAEDRAVGAAEVAGIGESSACGDFGDRVRAVGPVEFAVGGLKTAASYVAHDGLTVREGTVKGADRHVQRLRDGGRAQVRVSQPAVRVRRRRAVQGLRRGGAGGQCVLMRAVSSTDNAAEAARVPAGPSCSESAQAVSRWVSSSRDLAGQADEGERLRRVSDDAARALREAGMFRLGTPRAFGGHGAGVRTSMEVTAELACGDASAAWIAMIYTGGSLLVSMMDGWCGDVHQSPLDSCGRGVRTTDPSARPRARSAAPAAPSCS